MVLLLIDTKDPSVNPSPKMQILRSLVTAALAVTVAALPSPQDTGTNYGPIKPERVTFPSSGTEIVGYHYSPTTQTGNVPAVIVAHGLGGLQTSRIMPFAERFAQAGYHAMTFDYRFWGQSAGTPRNVIDVKDQQDDYRAAIGFIKQLPGVDPDRIVLWGTSLSGGHVLSIGADNLPGVVGIIAQCPFVSGPVTVSALPPLSVPGLTVVGADDDARAALDQPRLYIPLANYTGEYGALTQTGALEGYEFVQPTSPPPGNVMTGSFITELPFYNPDLVAAAGKAPTFIGVGTTDNITPNPPAIALATQMQAELREYNGGHFSVYYGASNFEQVVSDETAFLLKNVPLH